MSSIVPNRHAILMAVLFLLLCDPDASRAAAPDTGASVVARLYKDFAWQAIGGQSDLFGEDVSHQPKPVLEQYFDAGLTRLLLQDASCQVKSQGICNLDFDLIFASQDPGVTDLDIGEAAAGIVPVEFKEVSEGGKTHLDFSIVKVAGKWRINDIIYKNMNGASLKKILSQKAP